MKRFRNTPQAEADLDAITDYYAANNPDAGIRLLDQLTARCRAYPKPFQQAIPTPLCCHVCHRPTKSASFSSPPLDIPSPCVWVCFT
ncbi:type II toxin-antitoxin system RelE/ParE family toxin [Gemmata sp. G18]|uniref:Type II toxin-antitoxin system RelE/ParE family toxin n=1 Tax=Gemmata palustris TaxID=2822762 RepID=A0ABS5BKX2_9BACT|nr:type II toxin-antitoxin system RelE/ParE family toxin [Gemmata palustris]MBP3954351.1 type II toxin-antitoxin system RelE/ParE family toxin [Gemmata palustris]